MRPRIQRPDVPATPFHWQIPSQLADQQTSQKTGYETIQQIGHMSEEPYLRDEETCEAVIGIPNKPYFRQNPTNDHAILGYDEDDWGRAIFTILLTDQKNKQPGATRLSTEEMYRRQVTNSQSERLENQYQKTMRDWYS